MTEFAAELEQVLPTRIGDGIRKLGRDFEPRLWITISTSTRSVTSDSGNATDFNRRQCTVTIGAAIGLLAA